MPTRQATTARNAHVDAVNALVNAGAGPGTVQIRSGAQPATPNTAASGTLLATVTLNDPAYGAGATGIATLDVDPVPAGVGVADGTAGWWRMLDSTGAAVLDGEADSGELVLNTNEINVGVDVEITGGTLTSPVG